jgi:hypothetical protein
MDDQFLVETTEMIGNWQAQIVATFELHKGPGFRFSVEPFIEDEQGNMTYRVMDFITKNCVALCPNAQWALMIAERLNTEHVHLDEN